MAKFNATITALCIIVALAAAIFVFGGHLYMGADIKPTRIEAFFAHKVVDMWIARTKHNIPNPVPPTSANLVTGTKMYMSDCAGCHGDHQNPVSKFGRGLYPPAPQFVEHAPDMPDNENFVVIKHGTRWTGMPSWKSILTDKQIWTLAAFLSHMRQLPPKAESIWMKGLSADSK